MLFSVLVSIICLMSRYVLVPVAGDRWHKWDKVAQLVRCRTSNQRVAGSIAGRPGHFGLSLAKTVYSILLQSYPAAGYLA